MKNEECVRRARVVFERRSGHGFVEGIVRALAVRRQEVERTESALLVVLQFVEGGGEGIEEAADVGEGGFLGEANARGDLSTDGGGLARASATLGVRGG